MSCRSISELCARDASEVFESHLSQCLRCQALQARIETSEPELGEVALAPGGSAESIPEPGTVWTIWAPSVEEYLVGAILEADEEQALILPLFAEADWASEADLELSPEVLGYEATAAIWAGDRVLIEQTVEAVDKLSESNFGRLIEAFDAFLSGAEIESPGGPPILGEEDPRVGRQVAVADDLRRWYAPWAMLQASEELGPVIEARREDLSIELDELSEELDLEPRVWLAFESAKADPHAEIPVAAMARAIRRLGLLASRRVVSLAKGSVRAHNASVNLNARPAMARKMRGAQPRKRRDPEIVEELAERYGTELEKELGL